MGTQFFLDTHDKYGIYAVGAADGNGRAGILISRYFESDKLPDALKFSIGLPGLQMRDAKVYLLDGNHNLESVPCPIGSDGKLSIDMEANTMYYIEFNY